MEKFDRIIYDGKPCRIVSVSQSQHDALLEDEEGSFFTVQLAELETIDRRNVETR
jgi:hypothetical protein